MSPTTTETLLRASIELTSLRKRVEELTQENAQLRRSLGMSRLMADMRRDLDADALPVSMFHKRQI
jgi:hypothetical protein